VIDWSAYGQKIPPTITYSEFTGSPCRDKNPGSTCVYDDAGNGIYIYKCSGSATCDPGMGPGSGTKGGGGTGAIFIPVLNTLASLLESVTFTIDKSLGLLPELRKKATPPATPTQTGAVVASPALTLPLAQTVSLPADVGNPDGQVGCIGNETKVSNQSITKPVGQSISWVGSTPFAITVDQSICKSDNLSTPATVQSCMVMKPAPATTYTITDASCTVQPTLSTPTITALAATSPTR
jgi:hypothetical protein